MTGAIANLLVNVVIIALLVVTIGYCWVLNRRIKILQDSKGELAQLLKHFDDSTKRASESIMALQTASKKIGESMQIRAEKASYLLDDLAFTIEKAEKINNQLEAGFAVSRARSKVVVEKPLPADDIADEQEVEAGKPELSIHSLPESEKDSKHKRPAASRESTLAALQAVIERAKRRTAEDTMDETDEEEVHTSLKSRSKSEQELLEMIRAGFKG